MVSSRASRVRVFAFGLGVGAAACGLELTGAVGSSTTASGDGGSLDGEAVLDGANGSSGSSGGSDIEAGSSSGQPGGPITHLNTWTGSSTGSATITVADVTAASGLVRRGHFDEGTHQRRVGEWARSNV